MASHLRLRPTSSIRIKFEMTSLSYFGFKGNFSRASTNSVSKWFNSERVVLSRGLCTHFNLRNEASLSREQMARLAYLSGLEKSPFEHVGIYVRVGRTHTSIWSWDASLVQEVTGKAGITCVPESVAIDTTTNGFQLVSGMDGIEGCLVHENTIVQSRWWTDTPSEHEWKKFSLSAEQYGWGSAPYPDTQKNIKVSSQKIPSNDISQKDIVSQIHLDRVILVLLLAAVLILVFPAGRFAYLQATNYSLQSTIDQSAEYFEEKIYTLNQIRRISSETEEIIDAISEPQIIITYSQALDQITKIDGELHRVSFESGQWEIQFSSEPGFDPTLFVRSMENEPNIANVSIEPERREKHWITTFQVSFAADVEGEQ